MGEEGVEDSGTKQLFTLNEKRKSDGKFAKKALNSKKSKAIKIGKRSGKGGRSLQKN